MGSNYTGTMDTPFWDRVDTSGDCWEWTGPKQYNGYGKWMTGVSRYGSQLAHRSAWTMMVGEIPDDLELDHLCRNRLCVNPDHLEPVTHAENMKRGAPMGGSREGRTFHRTPNGARHCKHGHPLFGDNLYERNGKRYCKRCRADWQKRNREKIASRWR